METEEGAPLSANGEQLIVSIMEVSYAASIERGKIPFLAGPLLLINLMLVVKECSNEYR